MESPVPKIIKSNDSSQPSGQEQMRSAMTRRINFSKPGDKSVGHDLTGPKESPNGNKFQFKGNNHG